MLAANAVALVCLVAFEPRPTGGSAWVAAGLMVFVLASGTVLAARATSSWLQLVPALAYLGVIGLVRDATGGVAAVESLAILPVLWLAIRGTRAQLVVGLLGVAAMFALPLLLVGAPDYPDEQWRGAVIWVAVAAAVGFAVQGLVNELHLRRHRTGEHERALRAVAAITRLTDGPDARARLCEATQTVTGAAFAILLEPERGQLQVVGQAGVELSVDSRTVDGLSGAAVAFESGRRVFVPSYRGDWILSEHGDEFDRPPAVVFEPVRLGDRVVGLLIIGWQRAISDFNDREGVAVAVLAAGAGGVLERADLLAQLGDLARTDELTGLTNRRAWEHESAREHARARRSGQSLTIAIIDIDNFGAFDRSHGHEAADSLLQRAAERWHNELRETDTIARYGGQQFAIALPACPLDEALEVLERLRISLPEAQTCSVGVAVWDGSEDILELVARAEDGLYEAKNSGRDQIAVATQAAA